MGCLSPQINSCLLGVVTLRGVGMLGNGWHKYNDCWCTKNDCRMAYLGLRLLELLSCERLGEPLHVRRIVMRMTENDRL